MSMIAIFILSVFTSGINMVVLIGSGQNPDIVPIEESMLLERIHN